MSADANGDVEIVRHPSARRIRLSVDAASGTVRLTLPRRAPLAPALSWLEGKRGWIERQRARLPRPVPFDPDAEIPFRGHPIRIVWAPALPRTPRLVEGDLLCGGPVEALAGRVERWLKAQALALLSADSAEFAERAGVSVARIAVGDARRRWGSCSSSGILRYNWRLVMAPDWVRRATAAHEVAHRLHMDHSPAFHAAVSRLLQDDPRPANDWLRRHGPGLYWIGRAVAD